MEVHGGDFFHTLIFTAINFVLYSILLIKFVFPKLKSSLDQREVSMRKELEESRKKLREAQEKYDLALQRRKKADEEREKIKREFEDLAVKEYEKIIDSSKKFAESKMQEINALIEAKSKELKKELESYALAVAVELAKQKIKREKTQEDEKRFLSLAIEKIKNLRN